MFLHYSIILMFKFQVNTIIFVSLANRITVKSCKGPNSFVLY